MLMLLTANHHLDARPARVSVVDMSCSIVVWQVPHTLPASTRSQCVCGRAGGGRFFFIAEVSGCLSCKRPPTCSHPLGLDDGTVGRRGEWPGPPEASKDAAGLPVFWTQAARHGIPVEARQTTSPGPAGSGRQVLLGVAQEKGAAAGQASLRVLCFEGVTDRPHGRPTGLRPGPLGRRGKGQPSTAVGFVRRLLAA